MTDRFAHFMVRRGIVLVLIAASELAIGGIGMLIGAGS